LQYAAPIPDRSYEHGELISPTPLTAPLNLSWPNAARSGAVERFVEFVRKLTRRAG
jgi:hypothetical protein